MNATTTSRIGLCVLSLCLCVSVVHSSEPQKIDFNRDIRPILADNCYACHGPDKNQRKGKLRLDIEAEARADRGGYSALIPGKPHESELFARITGEDEAKRMPPAKFGKKLTREQQVLIRQWIEQGAQWQKHWSLIVPDRPAVPEAARQHAIDYFVRQRLEREQLTPASEADRRTLIRRLSFDLLGLPPTPEEVAAFQQDQSATAYEELVKRLLSSRHFGERMAIYWLDLVRYADTGGYHSDNHRDVTLYRDYVIRAFNDNKRFDQFTIEQLAGDLLPAPTDELRIASGYNRLLMTTEEGGAQPKEYAAKYAADRVRNASTVWLAATLGCTECHDHKFDPFYTKEFYRFAAFFADVQEKPVGRQDQTPLPSPEQKAELEKLDTQLAPLQKQMDQVTPELTSAQVKWEETQKAIGMKGLPKPVADILRIEPAKRTPKQIQALFKHFRSVAPELAGPRKEIAALQARKDALLKLVPTSLITTRGEPRVMRVLPRGNWLDDSGEVVYPGVPAALAPLTTDRRWANRLDLARWILAPENPATARVFVNRLWKLFFGQGIVTTLDDFGAQGANPTHPELLDWLAVEFRESGWDVKHMIKLMVTSATYRQSSAAGDALRQKDPYNRWLARQSSHRLEAEMVRDNALAVSGLLSRKIGGPSAKPYQPAGYWSYLNFPKREWEKDKGEDLYRRGLYTYWCRTFLHPSLAAFDAPTREECTVERPRSNTPLQALVLLNDPTYVEAARALAEQIIRGGGKGGDSRIRFAYRRVLQREPRPGEIQILSQLSTRHLQQYRSDTRAAEALLHVGERPMPEKLDVAELAAWTSVARVLLNLHETITRN